MKTISTLRLAIASVLALGAMNANAAGADSATMTVTAEIVNSCVINVANMDFGQYDPVDNNSATGSDSSATADLTAACTLGSAPVVKLDSGTVLTTADNANRALLATSGAALTASATLGYGLYSGAGVLWNNTAGETIIADGTNHNKTIYGVIPKGQNRPTGNYSKAVQVEISF